MPPKTHLRTVTYRQFAKEKEDILWLVDSLLPDTGWTLLVGRQGLGKTTLSLQLCVALQKGEPFLGRKTIQTDTLYIQADSSTAEWREMTRRIAPESEGVTAVGVEAKCLSNPVYVQLIAKIVAKQGPGFIVWDSLYNLTAVSINSDAVLQPVNTIKAICGDIPWLLIHHPPHEETRSAGHHSLPANCSNEWHLIKGKLKINKGRLIKDKEIKISRNDVGLWVPEGEDNKWSALDSMITGKERKYIQ